MAHYFSLALVYSFSLFIACSFVFFISGAYLLLFKIDKANQLFRHPYLDQRAFKQYPLNIRSMIVLDYFIRLTFPKSTVWIAGNANQLLKHVDPAKIPMDVKWPIIGLWGGCAVGMVAMLSLWILLMAGGGR
ncbi:MAG: hypothetical protein WCP99_21600 [Burkholderiales bacterium]